MQTSVFEVIETGIVYRNPVPHLVSRQAYFPWVVALGRGVLLASFVTGEAFESVNCDTQLSRSEDGGRTWSAAFPLLPASYKMQQSNCARLTNLGDGQVIAMVVTSDRKGHPDEGLANPDNLGFVPTDLLLMRSVDDGKTWGTPERIVPPLTGPSFEACSPVVVLRDGRWIWPTSTWRGWDGEAPNGMKMIALVSHDQGKTWPEYMTVMDGNASRTIYWEGKIVEMGGGVLLSAAWAYDEARGGDKTNHYAISHNGGRSWSPPASTGIQGQTMAVTSLSSDRLMVVYRRMDQPGLWVSFIRIETDRWINEADHCLWNGGQAAAAMEGQNMVQSFNELKFGAPCISRLDERTFLIAFWCYEQLVSNIRWFKVEI